MNERTCGRRRLQPLSLAVGAVWLVADQIAKRWAVTRLSGERVVHVVGSLQLDLTYNSGMAFGQGRGLGPVLGIAALIVVAWVLVGLRTEGRRWSMVAVGLVVGGAAGNLADRAFRSAGWFRGSVVDFIDLRWWPVFNVADIGVTVGGIMLVLGSLWGRGERAGATGPASSHEPAENASPPP